MVKNQHAQIETVCPDKAGGFLLGGRGLPSANPYKKSSKQMIVQIETHSVRIAQASDIDTILAFDLLAQADEKRQAFIRQAVEHGHCTVVEVGTQAVAFIIMERNFFGWPFIELVYVHTDYRQYGYATALMRHIENTCEAEKLFTSTNLSNLRMQRLLEKLGYTISGVVHNLDEGDPEVFYFKRPVKSVNESGYNTTQLSQ
jgi:ribosomal protein S18 acetylase RimI-like enzyme